jgi:hypothetical protein
MKGNLWNEDIADDVIEVVMPKTGSFATATNVWANSPEGVEHLVGLVLNVRRPKVHEVRAIVVMPDKDFKRFRIFFERDPCPVIFFGGADACPLCGESHGE